MKTATVGEIQKNFGKILKEISLGEEITIIKRGKPVAKLTVLGPKKDINWPDFYSDAITAKGKPTSQLVAESRKERF
jgi:antitoxin (DNA-binding transcriptional repressor) of toxin-antitoxin stability system